MGAESRVSKPARPRVYGAAPPRYPAGPTPRPEPTPRPGNPVGSSAGAGRLKAWQEGTGTPGSFWDARS